MLTANVLWLLCKELKPHLWALLIWRHLFFWSQISLKNLELGHFFSSSFAIKPKSTFGRTSSYLFHSSNIECQYHIFISIFSFSQFWTMLKTDVHQKVYNSFPHISLWQRDALQLITMLICNTVSLYFVILCFFYILHFCNFILILVLFYF